MAVLTDVSTSTTVRQLKKTLVDRRLLPGIDAKSGETGIHLFFSPVFAPMPVFGNPMEDDRSLGDYSVLHDDVLFCKPDGQVDPEAKGGKPAKEAKSSSKKKK